MIRWPGVALTARVDADQAPSRRRELTAFLVLALVLAPVLAVIVVAGYGFVVWMVQIIAGPPSV